MKRVCIYLQIAFVAFTSKQCLGVRNGFDDKSLQESCKDAVVDVGFILDSSGSLRIDYKNVKEFLKTIASFFDIKVNGSRAGVITFSHRSEHSIKLNDFSDIASFNEAVDKIPFMGSTTRIDKALRHSKNVMFTNQNGGRLEATKLLILLTDGAQTPSVEMEVPHIIADEIRQNGVSIIAIGIGEGINKTELSHIAGGDKNTYNADTFEELKKFDFIKRIKEVVCSSVKRSLSDKEIKNNDNTEGRSFGMDVVFAMDVSSYSSNEMLREQKSLIRSLTSFFLPSQLNKLGLLTYSNKGVVKSELSSVFDSMVLDDIDNSFGLQRVDSAVEVASEMFLKQGSDNRMTRNRKKVLVLFVTSKRASTKPPFLSERSGKLLHSNDVRTVVIALDDIGEDFARNIPQAYFFKYFEDEYDKRVKDLLQYMHKQAKGRSFGMDVVFAMDVSSYSSNEMLHEQKSLVRSLTSFFLPSQLNKLGLLTYSDKGVVKSELSSVFDSKILDDIDNSVGSQRVDSAVEVAFEMFSKLSSENKMTRNREKVLILFVTSKKVSSKPPSLSERSGKLLHSNDVRTVVIALDDIGEDFTKNIPQAYFFKYFEEKTDKRVQDYFHNINALTSSPSLPISTSTIQSTNIFTQVSTQTFTTTEHHVQPSCEAIVDVAFILDSSGSLKTEYQKEKNFLKTLAAMFGISPNGSRVGVITFSFHAQLSIKLNSFSDLSSFNAAVDNIPLMGLTTRIDRALRLAQNEMFTLENGGRIGVTKLIILLTDGSQTSGGDAEDPDMIADELRKEGFVIIGVGIGSQVNQTELIHISGSQANAYSAATFDTLKDNDFIHKIKNSSCEIAKVQPSCQAVVDIGFILDSSGSLRKDYHKEKDFLKSLIAVFGLSANGSRAGVITFSYHAEHSIMLNSFTDLSSFNKAVDDIPLMGLTTRIDKALRLAQRKLFLSKHGGRKGVAKLLFVLTDGSQTPDADAEDPNMIADELRAMGVSIIGIGIGSEVNETELAHIAGGESNRYSASTFDKLKERTFLNNIKMSSCKIASDGFSNGSITDITDDKNDEQKTTLAPLIATTKSFVFNQSCIKKTGLYTNASEGCFLKNMHLLDESIEFSNNLLLSGNFDKSIVSFPKSYLETIFKYEKNLRKIIFELQPSLERLGLGSSCILHDDEEEKSNPFLLIKKSDILDKAREMGGGQFVDMLWATGLAKEILNSNKDITLIVPLSIRNIPDFIKRKINNACLLRRMLNYHIVPGKQLLSSLKNNDVTISLYETNESINNNEFHELATLRGAVVKGFDIEVRGGVIHIVETFILPIEMDT